MRILFIRIPPTLFLSSFIAPKILSKETICFSYSKWKKNTR